MVFPYPKGQTKYRVIFELENRIFAGTITINLSSIVSFPKALKGLNNNNHGCKPVASE